MTTEERVEALERELAELKAGLSAASEIRANRFIVEDERGKPEKAEAARFPERPCIVSAKGNEE